MKMRARIDSLGKALASVVATLDETFAHSDMAAGQLRAIANSLDALGYERPEDEPAPSMAAIIRAEVGNAARTDRDVSVSEIADRVHDQLVNQWAGGGPAVNECKHETGARDSQESAAYDYALSEVRDYIGPVD